MDIIKDIQCIRYIRHLNNLPYPQRRNIIANLPEEKINQIRRLSFIANPILTIKDNFKKFDRKYIHPNWFVCNYWAYTEDAPYIPEAPETNRPAERGQFAVIAKTKQEAEEEADRRLDGKTFLFARGRITLNYVVRRPNLIERWASNG